MKRSKDDTIDKSISIKKHSSANENLTPNIYGSVLSTKVLKERPPY